MGGEHSPAVGREVANGFFDVIGGVENIVGGNEAGAGAEAGDLWEGAFGDEKIGLMASGGPLVGHEKKMTEGARKRFGIVEGVMDDENFHTRRHNVERS